MSNETEAEQRLRAVLAAGSAPAAADVQAVLDELARVRAESEARWQAIGQLAPAAKANRARAQDQARRLAQIGQALDRLARLVADRAPDDPLHAWLAAARLLVGNTRP